MNEAKYYGAGFPYHSNIELSGKLIVLEGTDGVGRSTQTQLLRHWLEEDGFAVSDTGLRRSPLTQPGLDAAKKRTYTSAFDHEPFLCHRFCGPS